MTKPTPVSFRLEPALVRKLDEVAQREQRTRTDQLIYILRGALTASSSRLAQQRSGGQ